MYPYVYLKLKRNLIEIEIKENLLTGNRVYGFKREEAFDCALITLGVINISGGRSRNKIVLQKVILMNRVHKTMCHKHYRN